MASAAQPLIPKGTRQRHWRSGFLMHAAQLLTDDDSHRVYFEARRGDLHHEDRFGAAATIGAASWPLRRIAGMRSADSYKSGVITTKPFRVRNSTALHVEAEIEGPASEIRAELLDAQGVEIPAYSGAAAAVLGTESSAGASWMKGAPTARAPGSCSARRAPFGAGAIATGAPAVRVRFTLQGGAKLFGFRFAPHRVSPCADAE